MTDLVRLLMICLAAGAACVAEAKVVRWLYHVEVQVASQSEAERRRAGRVALSEVLRRATGMADLPEHADLTAALRTPDQFYSRYEFASRNVADAAASDDAAPATFLAVEFEPGAVLGLLRRAGLPVWAANRPTVLAWVAVQRSARRELIGADANVFADALVRRSRQRGLELSLPLMDMADLSIAASDIWGLFWERIERASARYGADLLLVGRVREEDDGTCDVDWHLRSLAGAPGRLYGAVGYLPRTGQGFDVTFEQRAPSAEAAAQAGLDRVADVLAGRFAVRGELAALAVVVRGVDTIARYAALLRYLRSREYIERIEVRVAQHDALALSLHSRSGPEQLRELLALGGRFGESAESGAVAGALELSWQGGE